MSEDSVLQITSRGELQTWVGGLRNQGLRIGLVATMGALHRGHGALIEAALRRVDRVIVSVFVNPKQFGPNEDFARYPKAFSKDCAFVSGLGAHAVYAPSIEEMYPPGFSLRLVMGGAATCGLEDHFRPHFFEGVATVVAKLLIQSQADETFFGEKDYQQLVVVQQMARQLDLTVEVQKVPVIRESDGLALSSRNLYLAEKERAQAPVLFQSLQKAAFEIAKGEEVEYTLARAKRYLEEMGFGVDYLELREEGTLAPLCAFAEGKSRLLVAAWLGRTRLIDTLFVEK